MPLISRCYYCGRSIRPSTHRGRPVWECASCLARVGANPDGTPKGTPADPIDRTLRQKAHEVFDCLWRAKMVKEQITQREARSAGYNWLAGQLNIEPELCHIAMMHGDTLRRVIAVCRPYVARVRP